MKQDKSCWRADWLKDPQATLNACINEYRENSVRMSLVIMENGAYNKYEDMATNGTIQMENPFGDDKEEVASGSLENVHNNYHMYIGGFIPDGKQRIPAGHMAAVPTSAFDPIFWFHHWQVMRASTPVI
jgi:tyrosinase